MPRTQQDIAENLRLIDQNIHHQKGGPLVGWWCEVCKRKLYYPADSPKPQCPHCSTRGLTVRMRRYF